LLYYLKFGILYEEKSGNPGREFTKIVFCRNGASLNRHQVADAGRQEEEADVLQAGERRTVDGLRGKKISGSTG
jgi:hypothetical protein